MNEAGLSIHQPDHLTPGIDEVMIQWREHLLRAILYGASALGFIALLTSVPSDLKNRNWAGVAITTLGYTFILAITFIRLPYRLRAGTLLFIIYSLAFNSLLDSGLRGDARLYMVTLSILALMLFGQAAGWISLGVSTISLILTGWWVVSGRHQLLNMFDQDQAIVWVQNGVVLVIIAGVMEFAIHLMQREYLRTQQRERIALAEAQEERMLLEQRVDERTRAISASAQISRHLSTILDLNQLVGAVVEDIQKAFNYYHAQIYLLEEGQNKLAMVGGTGQAGQILVSQAHSIPMGKGLVGQAAEKNRIILVPDTSVEPNWLPNKLLPDTCGEIAVPITTGDRVVGVLDVQVNRTNGLSLQDADLLQSIANQVAIAVQNARSFSEAQGRAEQEMIVNAINQKIQASTNIETVLQVTARELSATLGARRAVVRVGNSRRES